MEMEKRPFTAGIIIYSLITLLLGYTVAYAQSVAELSVPEFTVTYSDRSYDIPASTSTDPYTGQKVENPAQLVVNRSLTFTIKNQIVQAGDGQLQYVIQMKGHFSENWTGVYNGVATANSEFTVLTFSPTNTSSFYLPYAGEVDFRMKAQTWGEYMATTSPQNPFGGSITALFGESDWSASQTITIPEPSPTPTIAPAPTESPTSTPSPTTTSTPTKVIVQPVPTWFYVIIIGLVFVIAILFGVIAFISRRTRNKT